jgi:hypothetical protein
LFVLRSPKRRASGGSESTQAGTNWKQGNVVGTFRAFHHRYFRPKWIDGPTIFVLEEVMELLLIILVIVLLFGGGGYYGFRRWR